MSEAEPALRVDGLHKRYGKVHAVDDLSFSAPRGGVLGLLGSNGAGKTTTVRIISTLLPFDAGTVTVLGRDVVRQARDVRSRIGLTGQYAALDDHLTGHENLEMIGRLHHLGRAGARRRTAELIELFELTRAAKRLVKTYSGGMRRRLDLAASLIIAPELLILDEPTTGLDPSSRRTVWALVRDLVGSGTSLLLTTQYLEEAEELADDIVVIDRGTVIAQGSPGALKEQVGGARLQVRIAPGAVPEVALGALRPFGSGPAGFDPDSRVISVPVTRQARLAARVIRALDEVGVDVADVHLREPTLDDVFLSLTGSRSSASQNA